MSLFFKFKYFGFCRNIRNISNLSEFGLQTENSWKNLVTSHLYFIRRYCQNLYQNYLEFHRDLTMFH